MCDIDYKKIETIFSDLLDKKLDEFKQELSRLEMIIEGEIAGVNINISKLKKNFSRLERKVNELESNQRSADSILRNVVQGNGRRIEKAPYELEGHGFVEEIKDYY